MSDVARPEWMEGFEPKPWQGRWKKGESGNPRGRPPGPSKQGKLVKQMLDGAADIIEAVMEKAKEGDAAAAGLVLSRIIPALRSQTQTVTFDFDATAPVARQVEQVLDGIASGAVPADIGKEIISAIGVLSDVRAAEQLEARIITLEAKLA